MGFYSFINSLIRSFRVHINHDLDVLGNLLHATIGYPELFTL